MATTCPVCGGPVTARPRGRPSVYCSRACQAKAYRARKATTGGEHSSTERPAGAQALADVLWRDVLTLVAAARDQGGTGDAETAAAAAAARRGLADLIALARQPAGVHATSDAPASRDETPAPVTQSPARDSAPGRRPPRLRPEPSRRDEIPAPVTQTREQEQQDWEAAAARDQAEFDRRLKPVPELGEGYQMAEWPGTGRYFLVLHGERIGHATKTTYGSQWEAHSAHGPKIPATGTYKTRRDALVQVALHHQGLTKAQRRAKRRR